MSTIIHPSIGFETDAAAAQARPMPLDTGRVAAPAAAPSLRIKRLRRHIAHRWDLYAVLMLMFSAGAYGVWSLDHLVK